MTKTVTKTAHHRPAWIHHEPTNTRFNHQEDDTYKSDCGSIISTMMTTSLLSSGPDVGGYSFSPDPSPFSGAGGGFGGGGADGGW